MLPLTHAHMHWHLISMATQCTSCGSGTHADMIPVIRWRVAAHAGGIAARQPGRGLPQGHSAHIRFHTPGESEMTQACHACAGSWAWRWAIEALTCRGLAGACPCQPASRRGLQLFTGLGRAHRKSARARGLGNCPGRGVRWPQLASHGGTQALIVLQGLRCTTTRGPAVGWPCPGRRGSAFSGNLGPGARGIMMSAGSRRRPAMPPPPPARPPRRHCPGPGCIPHCSHELAWGRLSCHGRLSMS